MKFLPLLWSNLTRRRARALFTALSIVTAFVLFGLLMAVRSAFAYRVELPGADRLMMFHKVSFAQSLPLAHLSDIAAAPGVAAVTHVTWFGGVYQTPTNFFIQFAVDPEPYLRMHPEYVVAPEQRQAWLANRTGCLVGRDLAARFGWKIGDRIPLQGTSSWRKPDGSAWTFTIDGIYEGSSERTNLTLMFLRYDYINAGQSAGRDFVNWYEIRVVDRDEAADVAAALDDRFANSPYETTTSTETAFLQAYASQIGDLGAMTLAILGAVLSTILLIAANTMAQAIRERTSELAVLKTLGFTDGRLLAMVLVESLLLVAVAGGAGLGIAWLTVKRGDPTGGLLPAFYLPTRDLIAGGMLAVALGLAAGFLPAWQAGRLRIVEALRRHG